MLGGMASSLPVFAKAAQSCGTSRSALGSADHHARARLISGEPQGPSHAGGKLGYTAGWDLLSQNQSL